MRTVLLMNAEMNSARPDDIKIVADWGLVFLNLDDIPPEMYDEGYHVMLEGPDESFKKWLSKYDNFWVGKGPPMLQEFVVNHIKE